MYVFEVFFCFHINLYLYKYINKHIYFHKYKNTCLILLQYMTENRVQAPSKFKYLSIKKPDA